MKHSAILCLCALGILPSCSHFSATPPKLADFHISDLNPFGNRIPIREVNEAELAALQDRTIAAHGAAGIPDASLRPVDFSPPGLPQGFDLLQASLLPPKSGGTRAAVSDAEGKIPEHSPIVPFELLDEVDGREMSSPGDLMEDAPLVPDAPKTVDVPSATVPSATTPAKTASGAALPSDELWGRDPFDE